jgi:3-methyladenine DNA glycosylase AlkC
MAEKLKDKLFLPADVHRFADGLAGAWPDLDRERFVALVLDGQWEERELKQRLRHLALCMGQALPEYPRALEILRAVADQTGGFFGVVLSEYVECFGVDDPERSLPALQHFTRFGSAEFAVRPFLMRDADGTLAVMLQWTADDNEHVRRLASEGCRPRLPWAAALPAFKADPGPLLPILEALKDDESEYVRRSVANNLNDISKDHPALVLGIGERWLGHSARTDRIVKHACRTLLKAGNPRAMRLFGFADPAVLRVEQLRLSAAAVPLGGELRFGFELHNDGAEARKVRLEYRVDYVKASGKRSPKVFQIKEADLAPGRHAVERKLSLVERSTRKHYPGEHGIAIVVNGVEKAAGNFELT